MNFRDRIKMYALGFIAGCFLVVLFFGRRNSCKNYVSNYLPQGRVLQEIQAKPILYSEKAIATLAQLSIDTATFRQQYIPQLKVDFDLSQQHHRPCGQYVTFYSDTLRNLKIELEKCKENSKILNISKN